jgi:hypothetical protein
MTRLRVEPALDRCTLPEDVRATLRMALICLWRCAYWQVMAVLWSMSLQAMHHTASLPTEEMCSRQRLMASALQVFRDADADHNGMLDAFEFEHALEEESVHA